MEEMQKLLNIMFNVSDHLENYDDKLTNTNLPDIANESYELLTDLFIEITPYLTIIKNAKFKEDLESMVKNIIKED